ncbi:hypothetical protein C8A01DRAFT_49549 [Parachaetomium inaequale]|uniref:Uncharacterized protein n=1 Tax=Parachaetomium inaequale TaxID=2588326 RepID=A0AAN6SNQ5_9PEZI|nr:hypothetical protein C8A01DRAFT_49549 [Parachaetomium inaequale]
MGLPPATPAPSRFLISKRTSTQQSQNQTPNQQYAQRSSQFHATPRFAASTPRPSSTQAGGAFTTPALAIKSRVPRNRSTQDIIDDSSPISPEEGSPSASPTTRTTLPEPIEFDSSLVPQSPSPDVNEGRSPKRRRISIASSEPETDPLVNSQPSQQSDLGSLPDAPDDHIVSYHSDVDDDEDDEIDDGNTNISPTHSLPSSPTPHPSPTPEPFESPEPNSSEDDPDPATSKTPNPTTLTLIKKPTFRPGPRFKPAEPPDSTFPSLPDAAYLTADIFSPQRRGGANKYLPGGLAAELRDWLVDVKGGVDGEGGVHSTSAALGFDTTGRGVAGVRVVVDGVERGGVGMTLVCGRAVVAGGTEVVEDGRVRVILAGEGNIEGLGVGRGGGNRELVVPGAVVAVVPPAWDVELDGQWAVAYRWEVVKGGGGQLDGG